MIDSQVDWSNIQIVQEKDVTGYTIPDLEQIILSGLQAPEVPITDKGTIEMACGLSATKNFKYFNDTNEPIELHIVSDKPSVCIVEMKNINIEVGAYHRLKFEVKAPITPCSMIVYIVIMLKSQNSEELFELIKFNFMFK